jgi:hypothetical protein
MRPLEIRLRRYGLFPWRSPRAGGAVMRYNILSRIAVAIHTDIPSPWRAA